MPRIASSPAELLDEADLRIAVVENQLANPSTATLVGAQQQLDAISQLLQESYHTSERWIETDSRYDQLCAAWARNCRLPLIREQVLAGLAPVANGNATPILVGASCYALEPFGDVALAALSAGAVGHQQAGSYYALWLPTWAASRLVTSRMIEVLTMSAGRPATKAEAEVAAALWNPRDPNSPYSTIERAHAAARAVLQD